MAQKLNGVIINADSMQVYKGANVVTASPSDIDKKSTPHKLYNVIDPFDDFNVIDWAKIALAEAQRLSKMISYLFYVAGQVFIQTALLMVYLLFQM